MFDGRVIRYEPIVVSTDVIGLTVTAVVVDGHNREPKVALVTVEDATIRFRYDGTDPTATEGHELFPGDVHMIRSERHLEDFRAIRRDSINAVIRVTQLES